jgi:GT2 family glycosyltransferase
MNTGQLDFSVIIPVFNNPQGLRECLGAISRMNYPSERIEVLVVDDGSPAPALDPRSDAPPVRMLRQDHAGPAAARNRGAAEARGRYLAFTDSDCCPAPDWLDVLSEELRVAPECAIGGRTANMLDNPFSAASQWQVEYLCRCGSNTPGGASFLTTSNLAVPRDLFLAVGGFDARFPAAAAEDRDFVRRWRDRGYSLRYVPRVLVHHRHHLTMWSYCRQHFTYGRGAHQLHSYSGSTSRLPNRVGFYWKLVTAPMSVRPVRDGLVLAALQVVSQAATAAGFLREAIGRRGKDGSRIAAVLP